MNLKRFEKLLKEVNPKFRIRQRGAHYIAGIFRGNKEFILTISKGHIPLNTYRHLYMDDGYKKERLIKRGRGEVLRILRQRGLITRTDSTRIKYGSPKSIGNH